MNFLPFGDSHTHFWGKQKQFPGASLDPIIPHMYWLGPAKIYGLTNATKNQTRERFLYIKSHLEQQNVTPIACLGEIDIRVNCSKEFLFHGRVNHIEKLVENYLDQLTAIKTQNIIIWGPPPSAPDEGLFATDYPAYGNNQIRNYLTHCFNQEIIRRILEYPKLSFITFFYNLINHDLTTKLEALEDGCHLSVAMQPVAIRFAKNMIGSGERVVLNKNAYHTLPNYRRVFREVTDRKNTPYINYYKKESGDLLQFFAYAPIADVSEKLFCADLEVI